jgi:RimJ/RimL family protein N-acetyltransferase
VRGGRRRFAARDSPSIARRHLDPTRTMTQLTTPRLRLEPYADAHLDALNAMNADPQVYRFLSGQPETRAETQAVIERVKARWIEVGYSWWALMDRASGDLVGAGCLQNLRREMTPLPDPTCPLEIGWRLRPDRWGRGLASEAAAAIADFAFETQGANELLAVCMPENVASAGVMARLGMQAQGLEHWYGREMTTYRITAEQWRANARARNTPPAR